MDRINNKNQNNALFIKVDGKIIKAYQNETVAVAMLASDNKIISRSIKYHRPRSVFCSTGTCQRCLVEINGIPNRRACATLVKEGMIVRTQNAYPSAEIDIFSILDRFSKHLKSSIYHHHFLQPKFMRQSYLKLLKRFTGLGRIDTSKLHAGLNSVELGKEPKSIKTEIAIVGAGLSGLAAAYKAAEVGASVVVIDSMEYPYGHQSEFSSNDFGKNGYFKYYSHREQQKRQLENFTNFQFFTNACLLGVYPDKHLGVLSNDGLIDLQVKRLILATGSYDALPIFQNNDLPGIYSARLVQKLIYHYGLKPGLRALICGVNKIAQETARTLNENGVEVNAFITSKDVAPSWISELAVQIKADIFLASEFVEARGKTVNAIKLRSNATGEVRWVKCDLVVICQLQPNYEIQIQAGCEMRFDEQEGGLVALLNDHMQSTVPWLYIAGEAAGVEKNSELCVAEGNLSGCAAALDLGYVNYKGIEHYIEKVKKSQVYGESEKVSIRIDEPKGHVCICEDVLVGELIDELEKLQHEQLADFKTELLKRRTGILTGPCEGKYCLSNFLRIISRTENSKPLSNPIPTIRPPIRPLTIKNIADGELYD